MLLTLWDAGPPAPQRSRPKPRPIRGQAPWPATAARVTMDSMRSLFRWLLRLLGLREAVEVYKALIRLLRRLR